MQWNAEILGSFLFSFWQVSSNTPTPHSIPNSIHCACQVWFSNLIVFYITYSTWSACWWERWSHQHCGGFLPPKSLPRYFWNQYNFNCISPVIQLLALSHARCFKGSLECPVTYLNIWVMWQLANIFLPELHRWMACDSKMRLISLQNLILDAFMLCIMQD